ncbi:MAG: hypothetical protein JWM49_1526 [Microbacteriaceae bacterium]|jgi:hypothetical protein|nr:hypothetical protein [Microbacteriaceae bacterium]
MRALVVYESMFGNTRRIAQSVGSGIASVTGMDVVVTSVSRAPVDSLAGVNLLVVGGPTHAHTMSTPASRIEASKQASEPDRHLTLERDSSGIGVREWMKALPRVNVLFAAFDTRADMLKVLSGAASTAIDRHLRRHGLRPVVAPRSFLVTRFNELQEHERSEAHDWGAQVGLAARATLEPAV